MLGLDLRGLPGRGSYRRKAGEPSGSAGAHGWKKQGERATEYEREGEYSASAARLGDASSPGAPHSQMWAHPSK